MNFAMFTRVDAGIKRKFVVTEDADTPQDAPDAVDRVTFEDEYE